MLTIPSKMFKTGCCSRHIQSVVQRHIHNGEIWKMTKLGICWNPKPGNTPTVLAILTLLLLLLLLLPLPSSRLRAGINTKIQYLTVKPYKIIYSLKSYIKYHRWENYVFSNDALLFPSEKHWDRNMAAQVCCHQVELPRWCLTPAFSIERAPFAGPAEL